MQFFNGRVIQHPSITFDQEVLFRTDGVHLSKMGNDIWLTDIVEGIMYVLVAGVKMLAASHLAQAAIRFWVLGKPRSWEGRWLNYVIAKVQANKHFSQVKHFQEQHHHSADA